MRNVWRKAGLNKPRFFFAEKTLDTCIPALYTKCINDSSTLNIHYRKEDLMIIIDYKDTRPIYEQVAEKFKNLILKGVLKPDEQMPSVRNLAMELSINPNTIQKAYSQLEREGFIYTVKGRGNFVAGSEHLLTERKRSCMEKILALAEEAIEYGMSKDEIIAQIQDAEI